MHAIKTHKTWWLVGLLCGLTVSPALAQLVDTSPRFGVGFPLVNLSRDSDDLQIDKTAVGLYPWQYHADHFTGLQIQTTHYRQNDWTTRGQTLSFVHRDIATTTGVGDMVSLGYSSLGGRKLLITETEISRVLHGGTQVSGFVSRDWVEAPQAIQSGVSYTLMGAGIEQQLLPRISGVASLAHTRFSDAHARESAKLRLIWDAWPAHGVTLQYQHRSARGEDDATERLYFNPSRYTENMALLGWRERWLGWQMAALMGVGRQRVNQDAMAPTRLFDLSLISPKADAWQVRGRVGMREAAGLVEALSTYSYLQFEATYAY
jgi:hypothetical protein